MTKDDDDDDFSKWIFFSQLRKSRNKMPTENHHDFIFVASEVIIFCKISYASWREEGRVGKKEIS